MTVLALKLSRAANGVSELHGEVSRHMWQSPLSRHAGGQGSHRPHHQRHSSARLDERHGAAVLAQETDQRRRQRRDRLCSAKNSASDWAARRQSRGILGEDDRPGIRFRRGTLGVALQAAPRTDRIRPPPPAAAEPARHAGRFHPLRPLAESRRADHRLCPPLRHLQARAADFPAVRQHREARARQAAARAVHLRRQSASARRRRQTVHPADHSFEQAQRTRRATWCSSKITTSTSRGRWFPAATSG